MKRNASCRIAPLQYILSSQVDKIRIGHDSRGRNKGIYVDEVEVTPENEDTVFFPCGCWLAEDMSDGKLEREIYMGHAPAPSGTGMCTLGYANM